MTDVLDATDNSPLSHCHAVPHLQLTIDPDGDVDAMLALTSSSRSICSPHIHPEIISPVSLSLSSTTSDWMMQDESTESDQESPYRYRITSTHTRSPSDSEMVIIHPEEDIETPRTRTRTRTPSLLPPSSFLFDPTHVNVGSTPYASPMSRGLKRPSVSVPVPHESTPLPSPLSSPLAAHKIKELRSHSPDAEKDTSPRDADIHAESQQEKDTQVHGSSQQETEISPSPSPTQSPQSQSQSQAEPHPQSQSQTMQEEQSQHQTQQTQTQTTQEEPSQTQEQTLQQPQQTQESQESQQTQESQSQESQETQAQTTQEEPSQSNTPVADTDTPTPPAELDTDSRPHVLHIDSSQSDITSTEIDSTATANIDMTPTLSISDEIDNSSPSSSTDSSSSSSPSDSDSEDDTMIRVCDPPTPLDVCHSSLPSPDSPTSAMPPPEQTVTLVDKDELRTHEDVQRSLHMRKQKMSRNPKRHDYMHRAKHQLLVHNATWNNEIFQNIMNGSNNESNTPTPRPRSKSISFFNQAKLRYYRHEEEPHRMYHRPTASTECSSLSMNDILSNKPKQGILKRTTYVGPIHLPPDEEETPRSQYSSSSSSSCSSSNNSSRRPSISKSQSFSRSSHSQPTTPSIPQIVWNEISSEVDAEELIRQEEAEMERLEQMESARRSHSRNNDTTPPSNRPLSVRPPLTLTISTSPITSPTSPMSSPFLISPPSSGGTVSPSGSYSSIFSSNPSLTLDSPSNIISSSHLDIISSSQLDIVNEELITSSQVVSNSDSDSEDEAEEQISS